MLRKARQAKLLLQRKDQDIDRGFALNTDQDLQLERDTLRKWQQAQELAAPINSQLRREACAQHMSQPLSRKNKGKAKQPRKVSVRFEESEESSIAEESLDESGFEMEDWESDLEAPLNQDSSVESVIMVATPLPMRCQAPPLSQTPVRPRHVSPIVVGRSVGSPVNRVCN
ncbi:hypothetical protein EV426DRAFT_622399 [Tirmania nivea]|nr:hypothetical protein EV426DRAFT_622399 [Tirmania nivea]